jgi:hypothetical protein
MWIEDIHIQNRTIHIHKNIIICNILHYLIKEKLIKIIINFIEIDNKINHNYLTIRIANHLLQILIFFINLLIISKIQT